MANLPESNEYPAGIYQVETTDPVLGGPPNEATKAGVTNIPAMQLAKRTNWLKIRVDQLLGTVVAATTLVAGIVKLSSAVNSTSTTEAATPAAVKSANDNANSRVPQTRIINATGAATGGGAMTADRTIDVPIATQVEAETGTNAVKVMTPLRAAQAVAGRLSAIGVPLPRQVSDLNDLSDTTGFGRGDLSTSNLPNFAFPGVLTIARGPARYAQIAMPTVDPATRLAVRVKGTDGPPNPWVEAWLGERCVEGFSDNSGYQRLPSGLIIQWLSGVFEASDGDAGTVLNFPTSFPTRCMMTVGSDVGSLGRSVGVNPISRSACRIWARSATGGAYANATLRVMAIGI